MQKTTKLIVQQCFVLVAIAGWASCGPRQPQRVGAPDDTYIPARLTVRINGASEVIDGAMVTPRFFTAENIKPLLGRFFLDGDFAPGQHGVAVLSHAYWVERFQSAPTVIGSVVDIEGRSLVIVGVVPSTFQPDRAGSVWIPKSS